MLLITVSVLGLILGAAFWLLRSRLTLAQQVVCVACLSATSGIAVVGAIAFGRASDALVAQRAQGLEGVVAGRAHEAEGYFRSIRGQIATFSEDLMVTEATAAFSEAFRTLPEELGEIDEDQAVRAMAGYFNTHFRPGLEENEKPYRGPAAYTPTLPQARVLQQWYIADNPHPVGSKTELVRAEAEVSYNRHHAKFHPVIHQYQATFEYYDVFLFDLEGNLVYSVFKETDYGTNLLNGPYADSNFGQVVRQALASSAPGEVFTEDFRSYEPSYGAPASFIGAPVFHEGEKVGAAVFQMPVDRINEIVLSDAGMGETGRTYFVGRDGKLRSNTRGEAYAAALLSQDIAEQHPSTAAFGGGHGFAQGASLEGEPAIVAYSPVNIEGLEWAVVAEMPLHEVTAAAHSLGRQMLFWGGGLAVLFGGLAWLVSIALVKPINDLIARVKDIAEGDADLTQKMDEDRHDELGELGRWFNVFVDRLHDTIAQATSVSNEVLRTAKDIASTTDSMAKGLDEQRNQTTQVAAGVEEMSATVLEVARRSAEASEAATAAGDRAGAGGGVVKRTVSSIGAIADVVNDSAGAVGQLGRRAEEIGQVINVINDIADQTNLLALNAAIEAARAGEHGRGFAVVADEVRKLAERTTHATEEVSQSIKAIQSETSAAVERMDQGTGRVQEGVQCAEEAGVSLDSIVQNSQEVADVIRGIAAATEQQSQAADDMSRSVESITQVTQTSASGAAQMARSADGLRERSEQLSALLAAFKVRVPESVDA